MLSSLLLVLAAAPIEVFVIHAPPDATKVALDTLKALLPNATLVDGSPVDGALFSYTDVMLNEFHEFTEAPPDVWPAPLKEQWTSTMALCRQRVGPKPWLPEQVDNLIGCSQTASEYLWVSWLKHVKATRVWEVHVKGDDASGRHALMTSIYVLRENTGRGLMAETTPVKAAGQLPAQLKRLKAGEGQEFPRKAIEDLAAKVVGDPFAGQKASAEPVQLARCKPMPATLEFKTASPLASAVAARWAASAGKASGTLGCSLEVGQMMSKIRETSGPVVFVVLTCDGGTARAEAPLQPPAATPPLIDLVSADLVRYLAMGACLTL